MASVGSKLVQKMIEGAVKQGKKPNYGKMKTDLNKKVREGTATAGEKAALKELSKKDVLATMQQKARQSASSRKKPVSLAGSPKVGGTQTPKSKLQKGLESVKDTKSPSVKKVTKKPMSAEKKKRVEEAKKKGSGALMREGLSDIKKKSYGGGMTTKKTVKRQGGSSIKPKGVGCAKSGYGKAMRKS